MPEKNSLSKEDVISFFDRHPKIAREPANFMIAMEWVVDNNLEPTDTNLDLAFEQCRDQFEPAFPSDEEIDKMSSKELKPHIERQFRKRQAAQPKRESSPIPFGIKSYSDWLHSR
ncbi:MAG TPA: hypothetical protein VFO39_02250 [Candidatus Sulfotelmatobacter sp.]|nr:hypothetical protein [Candidatus Sulfotelmatobacter sp.]